MIKYLQIYMVVILFIFFVSCKGQNKTKQFNENIGAKEIVSLESTLVIEEADTILDINAPSRITRKIRKDKDGNLLFAAFEDIIRYDGVSFTRFPKEKEIGSYDAFDVWEAKNGSTWIASTHFGVFQYPTSNTLKIGEKSFTHFTTKNGLAHDRAMCIYEDRAGGIWIGTRGGISYYDGKILPNKQVTFRNFTIKDGLTNNDVNTIMEDKTGKIWVGTRGTLSIYDPLTKLKSGELPFTEITNNAGKPFENIWSILEDKKGNIWLGGQYGLWHYDGNSFKNLSTLNVSSIYEDKKGNVWFTHSNPVGLSCYNQKSLLDYNPKATQIFMGKGIFFGVTEDKDGDIWFGELNGVFRYDGKSVNYFGGRKSKKK